MADLLDLSNEVLEKIFLSLSCPGDLLSLGSSSSRLTRLLSTSRLWQAVMDAVKKATREDVKKMKEGLSMANLPDKMIVHILLKLKKGEDMLSLATSLPNFKTILSRPRVWRSLLARTKTKMVKNHNINKTLIHQILAYLSSVSNPPALFFLLHRTICSQFPATALDFQSLTVSCPAQPEPHSVSGPGLELLAMADREGHSHILHRVRGDISGSLLLSLACLAYLRGLEMTVYVHCST